MASNDRKSMTLKTLHQDIAMGIKLTYVGEAFKVDDSTSDPNSKGSELGSSWRPDGHGKLTDLITNEVFDGKFDNGIRQGFGKKSWPQVTEEQKNELKAKKDAAIEKQKKDAEKQKEKDAKKEQKDGKLAVENWGFDGAINEVDLEEFDWEKKNKVYEGIFKNDMPEGQATITLQDDTQFIGQIKSGYYDGHGKMEFPNKETFYTGQWSMGLPHGHGECHFTGLADVKYVGQWEKGLPHGEGKFIGLTNTLNFALQYTNGEATGTVNAIYASGRKLIGNFKDNRLVAGKYDQNDGNIYEGEWLAGRPHGKGIKFLPDGKQYSGQFRFGRPWGIGAKLKKNGDRTNGYWDDDNKFVAEEASNERVEKFIKTLNDDRLAFYKAGKLPKGTPSTSFNLEKEEKESFGVTLDKFFRRINRDVIAKLKQVQTFQKEMEVNGVKFYDATPPPPQEINRIEYKRRERHNVKPEEQKEDEELNQDQQQEDQKVQSDTKQQQDKQEQESKQQATDVRKSQAKETVQETKVTSKETVKETKVSAKESAKENKVSAKESAKENKVSAKQSSLNVDNESVSKSNANMASQKRDSQVSIKESTNRESVSINNNLTKNSRQSNVQNKQIDQQVSSDTQNVSNKNKNQVVSNQQTKRTDVTQKQEVAQSINQKPKINNSKQINNAYSTGSKGSNRQSVSKKQSQMSHQMNESQEIDQNDPHLKQDMSDMLQQRPDSKLNQDQSVSGANTKRKTVQHANINQHPQESKRSQVSSNQQATSISKSQVGNVVQDMVSSNDQRTTHQAQTSHKIQAKQNVSVKSSSQQPRASQVKPHHQSSVQDQQSLKQTQESFSPSINQQHKPQQNAVRASQNTQQNVLQSHMSAGGSVSNYDHHQKSVQSNQQQQHNQSAQKRPVQNHHQVSQMSAAEENVFTFDSKNFESSEDVLQRVALFLNNNPESVIKMPNGMLYKGKIVRGEPGGQGLSVHLKKDSSIQSVYIGSFRDGKANGLGIQIFECGLGRYHGNWKHGKYSGAGIYTLKTLYKEEESEIRYEGQWLNGMMHGEGTFQWQSGNYHTGRWAYDQKQGYGKYYRADGTLIRQGYWKAGEFIGEKKFMTAKDYDFLNAIQETESNN